MHGGQSLIQKASNGKMTLKELCDIYLGYQHSRVLANELTPKHYNDQIGRVFRVDRLTSDQAGLSSLLTSASLGAPIRLPPYKQDNKAMNRIIQLKWRRSYEKTFQLNRQSRSMPYSSRSGNSPLQTSPKYLNRAKVKSPQEHLAQM